MAETLKTIWVVERRTDVSDWHPWATYRTRNQARRCAWSAADVVFDMVFSQDKGVVSDDQWTYRVAKYVRAKA